MISCMAIGYHFSNASQYVNIQMYSVKTLLLQNFVFDNSYFIHFFLRTNDCGDTRHTKKLALNKN